MKADENASPVDEPPIFDQDGPHADKEKKESFNSCSRILKDHDLDTLLVYQKRDPKQRKVYPSESSHKVSLLPNSKKERKKEKLQEKQFSNQSQNEQEKSREKINQDSQAEPEKKTITENLMSFKPSSTPKSVAQPRSVQKYQYEQSEEGEFKFPLVNAYYSEHSDQFLQTMQFLDKSRQGRNQPGINNTYINCDVKYFNWEMFIQEVGKFDVLVIDPPWRIKGAQKNDSQFMFSNCRFSLQYNTMSNHQIKELPLHHISDEGFIFLWILNTQLNSSLQIMQEWGYELVEQLVWVKLRNQKVYLTHGYYFMHSYEICLVGYKNKRKDGKSMLLRHGVNANTVFGEVRKKSQKPEDIYSIIEMVFKGKRKLEVFARNHNLRFGMFSIGNELGESYDKWMLHLNCDDCKGKINPKTKRYKSKVTANYDICQICIEKHNKEQFFQIANEVDEDVRHEYLSCNMCGIQPIWGIRFQCLLCMDHDLCESCFDKFLAEKNEMKIKEVEGEVTPPEEQKIEIDKHIKGEHQFRVLEVPVFGFGFSIHENKCSSCYQSPIIGVCLSCTSCKNFKLCQKCYFERPRHQNMISSKTHRANHEFEALFEPQLNQMKIHECFNCKKVIADEDECWMCQNCFNFFFCKQCYEKRESFKSLYANSHKSYHVFSKMF